MPHSSPNLIEYIDLGQASLPPLSSEEEAVLERVNRKVAGEESVEALIDFVFEATRELYPCDRIGLAFLEEGGARVVAHYAKTLYEPVVLKKGYAEDMRGSSLEGLMEGDRMRLIHDLKAYLEQRASSVSSKLLVREGVRSSLTCPIRVEGRRIGFLFRSSRKPSAYSERQARLHGAIAERLSQAVEKAYRIEQLTEANRAYSEMLGFVSHELKSPVASIVTDAQLIVQGFLGPVEEKQKAKIERMIVKANYLLNLVREYLDLARIEQGNLALKANPKTDFVEQVIDPVLDILQSQMEARRVRLEKDLPEGPLEVECDPDLMKIVMVNLVGNAIKYGNEEGAIRLGAKKEKDELRVSVWNEGPGFPPSQRSRLFRKFSRIQTDALMQRKGTGVGLYSTWRIVQLHGGRIHAKSEEGQWAEFSFEIPQPPAKM